jgi:hypothetical protein
MRSDRRISTLKMMGRGRAATMDSEKVFNAERIVREYISSMQTPGEGYKK